VKTFFFPFFIMLWTSFAIGQNQGAEPTLNNKTTLDSDNEVYYDELSGRLVATPNARLQSGKVLLTANHIELDRNQSVAYANGKVILTDGEVRLLADSIKLNFKTGNFVADEVKAGIHPWAFQSKEISRMEFNNNGHRLIPLLFR
jgi:lipopolysaccharide assembly outer membrane protein LptD (OstA)